MKNIKSVFTFLVVCLIAQYGFSKNPEHQDPSPTEINNSTFVNLRMDCAPARVSDDLEINNVRARLWVGGDVWWNKSDGRYIVPKPPVGSEAREVSSIFAGGVWLGGFDPDGNLKVAASTYPDGATTDYYPGPLDSNTGQTEATTCQQWDKFFTVKGVDIKKAIRDYDLAKEGGEEYSIDSVPDGVKYWPGQGNVFFEDEHGFALPNTEAGLGSFWDEDGDAIYSPENGDFPIIDIRGCEPESRKKAKELLPDEMFFWIYNDAGNIHRASQGSLINMEVQVQAFAYATNDEINDMTFLRYKLINRAKEDIRQTYFAMWVDHDLGCSEDDYLGCDPERGLVYAYNSDALDGSGTGTDCTGSVATYEDKVPMIGTDYFRGPVAPKVICRDSTEDCETHIIRVSDRFNKFEYSIGDEIRLRDPDLSSGEEGDFGQELGMSSFIYYNRGGFGNPDPATIDPQNAEQYYSYLQGRWLNGEPLTQGGIGLNAGSTDTTRYAFPDPPNQSGGWSMWQDRLADGDRRSIQASGPFLLQPNAINELIVGAVWVPDVTHPGPEIIKLTTADDIAQSLFDECFDIIDGPDAPTVCAVELDREIILVLNNDLVNSNNANLGYTEVDIYAPDDPMFTEEDISYRFEGYRIFQLVGPSVSPQELDDMEKARIVFQADLKNNVTELFNWQSVTNPNADGETNPRQTWFPTSMVTGQNEGIQNTFRVTVDEFASGDSRLINHKKYYFMAVAYAYNEFAPFNPNNSTLTQARPYLEGRGNVKTYEVVPRPIIYQGLNASYGDGAQVTRIDGVGVGGNLVDMEEGMHESILSGDFDGRIVYKDGRGPIDVNIYNPLEVKNGKFQLQIVGNHNREEGCILDDGATWVLTNLDTDEVIASEKSINEINEQLLPEYGFSIDIKQSNIVGSNLDNDNGARAAITEYEVEDAEPWFFAVRDEVPGIPDEEIGFGRRLFDFIRTGGSDNIYDVNQSFSNLGDGYWYPFHLTSAEDPPQGSPVYLSPAWNQANNEHAGVRPNSSNILKNLNNIDIVLTSDKSKWSRCVVVETASQWYQQNTMLNIKTDSPSMDKNGNASTGSGASTDEDAANYISDTGMSWFPGYAIDVETGRRVNIFFGENSLFNEAYAEERGDPALANGNDLLYNPNDRFLTVPGFTSLPLDNLNEIHLGGQHYIYATRQEYDGCESIINEYKNTFPFFAQIKILQSVTWCSMSLMAPGQEILSYAEGVVPTDVSFKLRVERPYNVETSFNLEVPGGDCFTVEGAPLPLYEFEIKGKEPEDLVQEEYEGALANVQAVPNPYYAYSSYEPQQFDRRIKITNLPDRAIVTIYSLDGKFIKQFDRAESPAARGGANPGVNFSQSTSNLEWDLENSAGIPIASGVYLIHISAPELGEERTIKWFGINRKFDPSGL